MNVILSNYFASHLYYLACGPNPVEAYWFLSDWNFAQEKFHELPGRGVGEMLGEG